MMVGVGTTSYTVGSIMDRLYQQFLTPPDQQDILVQLGASIDNSQTDVTVGTFAIPEDEALFRQGSILEADQEQMRVVAWAPATSTATVTRGENGTVPAAHTTPLLMAMNPPYTRATVFEAVADNIRTLYPTLFTVVDEYTQAFEYGVFPVEDPLAVEVMEVWSEHYPAELEWQGRIVNSHPSTGERAMLAPTAPDAVWAKYRRKVGEPTAESDTLDSLGVDKRWITPIIVGAAADLLVGRDMSAVHTDWVQNVLEAENIRVGTRMSLSGGLKQYQGMLIDDLAAELKTEYRPRIRMRNAIRQVTS